MARVGLELMVPAFARASTVPALHRLATVIGFDIIYFPIFI
jgi:hypothetical protein